MSFFSFLGAFLMALLTFYVNQRIHKFTNIKILINSLFDIYGNEQAFNDFKHEETASRLMDEIINIEKINDDNFFVNIELKKLKKLRLVYFHFKDVETAKEKLNEINFHKLDRFFIILAFLDIKLPRYIYIQD